MYRIPIFKWKSAFELLLFRELRDDVDDTLVQKLTTFVDSVVSEDSEYAQNIWQQTGLHESILRALDVSRRPASTAFALRLIGAFSQDERLFIAIKEGTQVLKKVADAQDGYATQDASVKVAYLRMLSSFLCHRSGNQWAVAQGLFPKVFAYLRDSSIFVQNEAGKFLSRYLILNLSTNPEMPEGRLLLDTICGTGRARHAKQCLRVVREVLEKDPNSAQALCSRLELDVRLLETLENRDAIADEIDVSELLCRLLCAKKDWGALVRVVDLLEGAEKRAALVRVASTILQTGDDGNQSADVKTRCLEVLTATIAKPETLAVVSSALCSLRPAITSLRDRNTSVRLLDSLASFLSRATDPASPWAKRARILAVACECFRACIRSVGFVELEPSKAESHLCVLLELLPNANLSCHAIEEALVASTALALVTFAKSAPDFRWTSSAGLRDLADVLRRRLVSTDPRVVEVSLETFTVMNGEQAALRDEGRRAYVEWLSDNALPRFVWDAARSTEGNVRASAVSALAEMCTQDHLWCLLREGVQVTESDVVRLVTATAVADADVFARRSATAALSRWARKGTLGADGPHGTAIRRAASESMAFDLDSEVQRCALGVWRSYLERETTAEKCRADTATGLLERADSDGLGASLARLLVLDCDETLRKEAVELLGKLRDRLRQEFNFVINEADDGMLFDCICKSSERHAKEERPTSTAEERFAAAEEVLDESVSESLRRKLVDRGDAAGTPTGGRLSTWKTDVTTLQLLKHKFETVEEDRGQKGAEFLLDDILGAAATERRDLDCY